MSKLQAVRDLLTAPESWLKGDYSDNPSKPTCWCLNGAVAHAEGFLPSYERLDTDPIIKKLAMLIEPNIDEVFYEGPGEIVARWNDHPFRTHDDILALLDLAIGESK